MHSIEDISQYVGFCSQDDLSLPQRSVYENLCFFAELKSLSGVGIEQEVSSLMNKLRLYEFMNTASGKLSEGMRRRLNIAIALLKSPRILLLDEPTAGINMIGWYLTDVGLDPVARREFWQILAQLRDEGRTILLTTQFFDEVEQLADRVAVFSRGSWLFFVRI